MKKILSLIYKVAIILAAVYGLYLNFEHSGFRRMIVYFTMISNFAVLMFFIIQIFCEILKIPKKKIYYILKLILLTNILITMFAFQFVVRPYVSRHTNYSSLNMRDTMVHLVIPIMTLFDYLLFDEKGKFSFEYIQYSAASPIGYLTFCFIYAKCGGTFTAFKQISKYPYVFMDFDSLGNFAYMGCALTLLVFLGMAWLLVFIDKKLKSISKRES